MSAITFVQWEDFFPNAQPATAFASAEFGFGVTTGNSIVVAMASLYPVTSVSDNKGNSYSPDIQTPNSQYGGAVATWRAVNVTGGTVTVTVEFSQPLPSNTGQFSNSFTSFGGTAFELGGTALIGPRLLTTGNSLSIPKGGAAVGTIGSLSLGSLPTTYFGLSVFTGTQINSTDDWGWVPSLGSNSQVYPGGSYAAGLSGPQVVSNVSPFLSTAGQAASQSWKAQMATNNFSATALWSGLLAFYYDGTVSVVSPGGATYGGGTALSTLGLAFGVNPALLQPMLTPPPELNPDPTPDLQTLQLLAGLLNRTLLPAGTPNFKPRRISWASQNWAAILNSLLNQFYLFESEQGVFQFYTEAFLATRAPTVNDDVTVGAIPTSCWIQYAAGAQPVIWFCQSNAIGAADWTAVKSTGGGTGLSGVY